MAWEKVATERAQDGGELILYRRGDEYMIRVDGHELMSSRAHGSEEELARLACQSLGDIPAPKVLLGGLGMGYTLRAALDVLPPNAVVIVVELVSAVLEWNRGPLGTLARQPLRDQRVRIRLDDVGVVIRNSNRVYHAIILDVDNGPVALTSRSNRFLYSQQGLAAARRALTPGGILAVWSASPDEGFAQRLRRNNFSVNTVQVAARGCTRDPKHTLFIARTLKPSS